MTTVLTLRRPAPPAAPFGSMRVIEEDPPETQRAPAARTHGSASRSPSPPDGTRRQTSAGSGLRSPPQSAERLHAHTPFLLDDDASSASDESCTGARAGDDANARLTAAMGERGWHVEAMEGDGNCLFRAVSHQLYGDAGMHDEVRAAVVAYMSREREHFASFVGADISFDTYLARMARPGVHGGHAEIQAAAELYNRPVEIYSSAAPGHEPVNIFHGAYDDDSSPPIRLAYRNGNHYDLVLDRANPSVGVGLGLPGSDPAVVHALDINEAVTRSERDDVESAMLAALSLESEREEMDNVLKVLAMHESLRAVEKRPPAKPPTSSPPPSASPPLSPVTRSTSDAHVPDAVRAACEMGFDVRDATLAVRLVGDDVDAVLSMLLGQLPAAPEHAWDSLPQAGTSSRHP